MNRNISFLALGVMPGDANPESWLAAGPWCFAGQEGLFPNWETEFLFAPEPLADGKLLPDAIKAAQTLALLAVPEIAARLTPDSEKHSALYWQTLLLPWLLVIAQQIVERSLRLDALVEAFGDRPLKLQAPAKNSFFFEDEAAFMRHGCLNIEWNHWLFFELLRNRMPEAWEILPVEASAELPQVNKVAQKNLPFQQRLKNVARKLAYKMPFPPLKGVSLRQAALFSLALLKNRGSSGKRHDLLQEYCHPEILNKFNVPENWLEIMLASLPESLKGLKHGQKIAKKSGNRLRVASVRAYEDAAYRQELALWVETGNRLAYVQHGCNYGQIRNVCDVPLVEYSHDVFFTWGWNQYSTAKGNFQPMPYPQLARIAGAWNGGKSGKLIMVGTEMASLPCRLLSQPSPLQRVEYRKAKACFFKALPKRILSESLYRAYFDVPGCLEDASWLLPKFPELGQCKGSLLEQILACRLLVVDHLGTVMLEAFAAGIPMLLFWDRRHWRLGEECDSLLDSLEKCGIWQPDPEKAAKMAEKIWQDPASWLKRPEINEAYEAWRHFQARVPSGSLEKEWVKKLEYI